MGVTIREARLSDIRGIARVHIDTWETTYRGLIPDAALDKRTYEWAEASWQRRLGSLAATEFTFVAEEEAGRVVGFAFGGPPQRDVPPYKGELRALYILKDYQRLGIGRRLVSASARRLHEVGLIPMVIWVLADNPSRGFYEHLGGRYLRTQSLDFDGASILEMAYGWDDLSVFLNPE